MSWVIDDRMNIDTKFFVIASVAILLMGSVMVAHDTDAAGEDLSGTYGDATNIDIAPGFRWTYTPEFPSDLSQYVTVSLKVNDENVGSVSGKTIIVNIPANAQEGTVYNVVIQASMSQPVQQTAYQYVTFTVVSGLTVSGTINDIIKGSKIDFTPIGQSDMGNVTWAIKSGTDLPAGLTFSNGKVTGTPTTLGLQRIQLTATALGQTADLVVEFTVYSKIVDNADETITSIGGSVAASTAISNGNDIDVKWAVQSGSLPTGFTLNADTGVISGSSSTYINTSVTIRGTSTDGPAQYIDKVITIHAEPTLVLTTPGDILTYLGNGSTFTSTTTSNEVSKITFSVSGGSGITHAASNNQDGKAQTLTLTVKSPTTPGMSQTVTITATTAFGQTKTVTFTEKVEDTLRISGDTILSAIVNQEASTSAFTVSGGSGNSIIASTDAVGLNEGISGGCLKVNSASPLKDQTVTVTVQSAAGQTASCDVEVDVFNKLVFNNAPSGGAIIYPVAA